MIETGKRLPPPDKIDRMASTLGLSGDDRDAFIRAAHMTHATDWIGRRMALLDRRIGAALDVCVALYELIHESGDDALRAKADALWDQSRDLFT